MLSPSMMTSPRLTPKRKMMRRSSGKLALRPAIAICTSITQRTAIDRFRKFEQNPMAGGRDDRSTMRGGRRSDQIEAYSFECGQRAALVSAHQPGAADYIRHHDHCQSVLL